METTKSTEQTLDFTVVKFCSELYHTFQNNFVKNKIFQQTNGNQSKLPDKKIISVLFYTRIFYIIFILSVITILCCSINCVSLHLISFSELTITGYLAVIRYFNKRNELTLGLLLLVLTVHILLLMYNFIIYLCHVSQTRMCSIFFFDSTYISNLLILLSMLCALSRQTIVSSLSRIQPFNVLISFAVFFVLFPWRTKRQAVSEASRATSCPPPPRLLSVASANNYTILPIYLSSLQRGR